MKSLLKSRIFFTALLVAVSAHASPPYSNTPVTQADLNALDDARLGKIHDEYTFDASQVGAFFKINNICTNSIKASAEFVKKLAWFGNITAIRVSSLFAGSFGQSAHALTDLDLGASAINFETERFVKIEYASTPATTKADTHFAAIYGTPKENFTMFSCFVPVLRRMGKTRKVEDFEFFIGDPLSPEILKTIH